MTSDLSDRERIEQLIEQGQALVISLASRDSSPLTEEK